MSKEKTIHQLDLHESIEIDNAVWCRRVPGGWIYTIYSTNNVHTLFVPYSDEFI